MTNASLLTYVINVQVILEENNFFLLIIKKTKTFKLLHLASFSYRTFYQLYSSISLYTDLSHAF